MIQRIPKLPNELVGKNLLGLRFVGKTGDKCNCPLHNHGLVILLNFTLELGTNKLEESLEVFFQISTILRTILIVFRRVCCV